MGRKLKVYAGAEHPHAGQTPRPLVLDTRKVEVLMPKPLAQTVGRRKTSVVRVRLYDGAGKVTLNGKAIEVYFPSMAQRLRVLEPLRTVGAETGTTSKPSSKAAEPTGRPTP